MRKEEPVMKKHIGFITLDFSLAHWLSNTLRTAPRTPAAQELLEGVGDLMNGSTESLMLELGEREHAGTAEDLLRCGDLSIDLRLRRVSRNGEDIALTPKEFDILYFLARNRGEVFTKEQIYQAVWESSYLLDDSNITGKGMIDPTPLWDEDGKVYLIHAYAGSRSGVNSILVICELNAEGTEVISDPVMVFDGNDGKNHTVEGPKLYKRNGYYYIFAPAGGVATGWQLVLRSRNIYGPYESKIVMAQGKTTINGPHQGGWVDTNTGESWFVHFQDQGAYGRVIHLNPMKWVNEWPVIGVDKDKDGCGEPVTTYKKPNVGKMYPVTTPPESDEFDTRHLGLQWQWHANKQDTYGFTTDLGYIRLYAGSLSKEFVNFWEVPNLLLQKFPAEEFTATTKLTFTAKQDGEQAGMIVMGWDYSYLSVRKAGDKFILQQVVCKDAEQQHPEQVKELASFPVEYLKMPGVADNEWKTVYLRVKVAKGAVCTFAYSLDGKKYTAAGEPFTARQGKWIGAKVGLFCVTPNDGNRGWADVDWFRVTK